MKLMIHTIQVGDELTMIGPDGRHSERFVLADLPALRCDYVWLYRANDVPIIVERGYGLDSTFELHLRQPRSTVAPANTVTPRQYPRTTT